MTVKKSGTKKKKKEKEFLGHGDELMRLALANIREEVYITDDEGSFTFVSPNAGTVLGYTGEDIRSMGNIRELLGEDFFDPGQLEARGELRELEFEARDTDGKPRWLLISIKQVVSSSGATLFIFSLRDITSHKRSVAELNESKANLSAILENTEDIVVSRDGEGCAVIFNKAFADITEKTFGVRAIPGFSTGEHLDEPRKSRWEGALKRAMYGESLRWDFEWDLGSETRYFDVSLTPIRVGGNIIGTVEFTRDITARKLVEKILREREQLLRTIMENVASVIVVKDRQGRYLLVSRKVEEITGLSGEEIVGRTAREIYAPEIGDRIYSDDMKVMESGRVARFEERLRPDDHLTYLTTKVPLVDEQGGVTGLCGIATDISELKRAEEELRRHKYYLEKAQEIGRVGSWELDLGQDRLFWTEETYRIFGVEPGTVLNTEIVMEYVHPDDRDYVARKWRAALDGGESYDTEHRIVVDSREKWVREKAELEFDEEGGGCIRAIGFTQDITDFKLNEDKIVRSNRLLDAISYVQSKYIVGGEADEIYRDLLRLLIELTDSELGFLDEVAESGDGRIQRKNLAVLDFSRGDESRLPGDTELRVLESLAELPARRGETVISNDVGAEESSIRASGDNGRIRSFKGIPMFFGTELVGVAGVANRPGGYSEQDASFVEQLTAAGAALIRARKSEQQKKDYLDMMLESERRYRKLAESTSAVLWEYDILSDRWSYVSPQVENVLGYDPGEWRGLRFWRDRLHPEDIGGAVSAYEECMAGGEEKRLEYRFRKKQGGYAWLRDFVSPESGDGEMRKLRGFMVDITDLKSAEEALRGERKLLHYYLDSIPMPVYLIDSEYRIRFSNRSFREWFGDPGNRPCFDAINRESKPCEGCLTARTFDTFRAQQWEWQTQDGRHRMVYDTPVVARDGSVMALVVLVDITEQKQLEQERIKSSNLESIGVLAGGIAHDFNNILTAILGNISLAEMHIDNGQHGKIIGALKESEKAGQVAKDLAGQLLTFSKGGDPVKRPVSLSPTIREACDFSLSGSNVRCEYEIDSGLWPCEADDAQLKQVLNNLTINAMQAMPTGGTITVRAVNVQLESHNELSLEKGPYVRIDFIDRGHGIPRKYLQRVFDPYFTTKQVGHGLGLSTVYSIIRKHGGSITVESATDEGAVFHIYLPALMDHPVEKHPPGKMPETLKKGRVLVMDDDSGVRSLAVRILESLGQQVVTANHGGEAVEMIAGGLETGKTFDAAIFDLTVPGGMGGVEAAGEVRRLDRELPLVVASGYSNDPVMEKPSEYGFCAAIGKPFGVREMRELLSRVLR